MAWSDPRTWVAGELLTASLLNTHVRDNLIEVRRISGHVAADGSIVAGEGFGVVKTGTGAYQITLDDDMDTNVHMLAIAVAGSARTVSTQAGSPLTSRFNISTFAADGTATDSAFKFTASNATDLA